MYEMTLTPVRNYIPVGYASTIRYVDYGGDVRMPERRTTERVDGKMKLTRITQVDYRAIKRECYTDPRIEGGIVDGTGELRASLIKQGLIKPAGWSYKDEPCLMLTFDDWCIAMDRCSGALSGDIDLDVGTDTEER